MSNELTEKEKELKEKGINEANIVKKEILYILKSISLVFLLILTIILIGSVV